ncbi:MAG: AAA family ATPase [Acidimicrobiales bacterium]
MSTPVLHLLVGPNGAGKSTLYAKVIGPTTRLEFVNADEIAHDRWPGEEVERSYDAAVLAAEERDRRIAERRSFVAETVFSHESKLALIDQARANGYVVILHLVIVPEELAFARVADRVRVGGHDVPEDKIRSRYRRLWPLVVDAIGRVDEAHVYDNSITTAALRRVAAFARGQPLEEPSWPEWTPNPLRGLRG